MKILRWRQKIREQQQKDVAREQKLGIPTTVSKDWVSPADIEALEEQMVPWLRNKRRR
jgi:hypothetical protein